jgi:hypothetical protein
MILHRLQYFQIVAELFAREYRMRMRFNVNAAITIGEQLSVGGDMPLKYYKGPFHLDNCALREAAFLRSDSRSFFLASLAFLRRSRVSSLLTTAFNDLAITEYFGMAVNIKSRFETNKSKPGFFLKSGISEFSANSAFFLKKWHDLLENITQNA